MSGSDDFMRRDLDKLLRKRPLRGVHAVAHNAAAEAEKLRRRISTLEERLARVLRVAQGTGLSMYWTDHNGGGAVWQWRSQKRKGPAGRAWSRKRTGGRK